MLHVYHHRGLTALCVTACAAAGTLLLTTPALSTTPATAAKPVLAQLSAQAIAAREQPLLQVANDILRLTGQGKAAGYSGYGDVTISVPKRQVTLYWHGSLPGALRVRLARLRTTAPVDVVAAPYTWQQLETQAHQIAAHRVNLRAEGYTLSRVGPAADATGLHVGVDYAASDALAAPSGATAAALTEATPAQIAAAEATSAQVAVQGLVPGPAPVTVSDAPLAQASSNRNNDASPWKGGARISRAGDVDCSSGFSVITGLTHELVTAGHCGGISTEWVTGDDDEGTVVGTETARDPCCDTAIIKVGTDLGAIWDGGWATTTSESVVGPETAVVGTLVCDEGASSGVRCAINTVDTGLVVNFTDDDGTTFTAENEAQGIQINETQATAGGDSGGPVIINSGTAGHVYATGTISGGYGQVSCSNVDSGLNPQPPCWTGVFFEEIVPILNRWGVTLITS